jgi:hypothetical protein
MGSIPSGISGSRAAAVLGISGFTTKLAVWQEIVEEQEPGWNAANGFELPAREETAAMRWGTAFEDAIINLAYRTTGERIKYRELFFSNNLTGDWTIVGNFAKKQSREEWPLTCHVDGIYQGGQRGSDTLHEGKTTSAFTFREKWGTPGTDHIPAYYKAQVQHQMICTGAERVIVSVLVFPETPERWEEAGWEVYRDLKHPPRTIWVMRHTNHCNNGEDEDYEIVDIERRMPKTWANVFNECGFFHQYPVSADKAAQEAMLERYRDFWESVTARVPPSPENYDDIKRLFPSPRGTLIVPSALELTLREYKDITTEIGEGGPAAKRREQLKVEILSWARAQAPVLDDESTEALVMLNETGEKCGSFGKTKTGALVFRT